MTVKETTYERTMLKLSHQVENVPMFFSIRTQKILCAQETLCFNLDILYQIICSRLNV